MIRSGLVGVLGGLCALGCSEGLRPGAGEDGPIGRVQSAAVASMVWDKSARLTSADELSGDMFGRDIDLEGDTLAVGAYGKLHVGVRDVVGAVYVFERSAGTWGEQKKLMLTDPDINGFGWGVALSGETLLTTSIAYSTNLGKAFVYVRSGDAWNPQAVLTPPGSYTGADQFGMSVALEGDTAFVGSHGTDTWAGAVWAYERSGTTWGTGKRLVPGDAAAYDFLGFSMAMSGDTVVLGTYGKNGAQGAAYVFVRDGADWKEQAKLVASDAANLDQFGFSVGIDGNTAIVGANFKASKAGAAYVFTRSGTTWTEQQKLVASDPATNDQFGYSVAVKGDAAIVGARHEDLVKGSAYFFTRTGSNWTQQQKVDVLTIDPNYGFGFGADVAIDGDLAMVGADRSFAATGAVYALRYALSQGSDCNAGSACHSGHCTDGVCCETACAGECSACVQSLTGKPDGECQPIPADQDPEDECAVDAGFPANCGATGFCDGSGQCEAYAEAGTTCGATECDAGALVHKACDGSGVCLANATECAPYVCDAATPACVTNCEDDDDCQAGNYCSSDMCVPKRPQGEGCQAATECQSGFCVDGVCCESACAGQCEACAEAGQAGSCAAVSGAPRGPRRGCTATTAECGGRCDGTVRDACSYADSATSCGSSCLNGVVKASMCDGEGGCAEGATVECSPYVCRDETECRTSCGTDEHCAAGFSCEARKCVESMPAIPGDEPSAAPSKETSGCNCRLATVSTTPTNGLLMLGLAALTLTRRRRRWRK